jgi:hypothetical protein
MSNTGNGSNLEVESGAPPASSKPLAMIAERTIMEKVLAGIAVISVTTSLVAMIIEGGLLVLAAGILTILLAPYAYFQQTRITDIKALKETYEAAAREVSRLSHENKRLAGTVGDLRAAADRLEASEEALSAITETQGMSISEFKEQVEENKLILGMMQQNHKASVVQNILSVIMGSDANQDFVIGEDEAKKLIERLDTVNGVEIDEAKLRKVISDHNGSLDSILDVLANLLGSDVSPEDAIFKLD